MSVGRRSELWAHFYPYYLDRSGKYYRCVYCGEIVHSSDRRNHLRYKHKEIWEKMRMARRAVATVQPGGVI
ncbi:hypothetical protein ABOONEI_466 [Aciduliprofundum boonei T469]|nr:hypothetical protein ABOONEI_466 [Aciduliprofundum boonei T469]